MVKWAIVPSSTDGSLPIQFFKVQYMIIPSDFHQHKGHKSNEDWMTLNEDIPPHLRSYEIHHLKLESHYKFRISAVYSNNDNKQSPIRRFHMKRVKQSVKAALPIPNDILILPVSETEVTVRWSISEPFLQHHTGFYISYRPTTSADEYSIVSAEGSFKRHILIKHLEPGMNYEFKIQSFSPLTASEFSSIVMGRTLSEFSIIALIFCFFNNLVLFYRTHLASNYNASNDKSSERGFKGTIVVLANHCWSYWSLCLVVFNLPAHFRCPQAKT